MLSKKTTEFIKSLKIDDLTCFLVVYSNAKTPLEKAQLQAIKKELKHKVSKADKELWEGEIE